MNPCRATSLLLCSIVLLSVLALGCVRADDQQDAGGAIEVQPLNAGVGQMLDELGETIRRCVSRHDTDHVVFHGCIDWHSSVHGHWALLRVGALRGRADLIRIVTESMQQQDMARERSYLAERPSFEMPYGRAWFLLLLREYEIVTGDAQFRPFMTETATSLHRYLQSRRCDLSQPAYRNQAWAYYHLFLHARFVEDVALSAELEAKLDDCAGADVDFAYDATSHEFFSVAGNAALLFAATRDSAAFADWSAGVSRNGLQPVAALGSDHHLAINYSRAWGFWSIYARTGEVRFRERYDEHVKRNFALHEKLAGDYIAYGHWVAQFGVFALTLPVVER